VIGRGADEALADLPTAPHAAAAIAVQNVVTPLRTTQLLHEDTVPKGPVKPGERLNTEPLSGISPSLLDAAASQPL
jgi:hypothetical protein